MDNKVLNELEKHAGMANPAISSMLGINMTIGAVTKDIESIDINKMKEEFILKKPIINKTPKIYVTIKNESETNAEGTGDNDKDKNK